MINCDLKGKKEGRKISTEGSGELKKFCLQHPFLILQAVLGFLFSKTIRRNTTRADV